jgi:hypothetical protein
MLSLLAAVALLADATSPVPPVAAAATPPALATHAALCRPSSARRCSASGCEPADEGLHAEQFELDVEAGTIGACLYTDCYSGAARVVRDPAAPWLVTAFGEVRSARPAGSVPPPGGDPFALTVSVDLRDGRFTAIWSLTPGGLQVDFGRCELRRPAGAPRQRRPSPP